MMLCLLESEFPKQEFGFIHIYQWDYRSLHTAGGQCVFVVKKMIQERGINFGISLPECCGSTEKQPRPV